MLTLLYVDVYDYNFKNIWQQTVVHSIKLGRYARFTLIYFHNENKLHLVLGSISFIRFMPNIYFHNDNSFSTRECLVFKVHGK